MSEIDIFKNPSPLHLVSPENEGFSISPISDGEIELEQFQSVALAALSYSGSDYSVREHCVGFMIDSVYFQPLHS